MDAYQLAESKGIHYSGDVNLEHGGYFFSLDDIDYGYVNAIEFEVVGTMDSPTVLITQGAINVKGESCNVFELSSIYGEDEVLRLLEDYRRGETLPLTLMAIDACKNSWGIEYCCNDDLTEIKSGILHEGEDDEYEGFEYEGKGYAIDSLEELAKDHFLNCL